MIRCLPIVFTLPFFLPGYLSNLSKCSKFEVVVFDSYGTLLNVNSLVNSTSSIITSMDTTPVVNLWRTKQLEYTWLRSLMQSPTANSYANFWVVTEDALQYALDKFDIRVTQSEKEELLNGFLQLCAYPDVREALTRIKAKYPLAVLSNGTPRMLREAFHYNGLDDLINSSNEISVDEVRVFKPHPNVYALAEKRLVVHKSKILFVSGNNWDSVGAKSYGFHSVWLNRQNDPKDNLGVSSDLEFSDLYQVANYLGA